ncbi:MAG: FprA family A-type flavoprotein [Bacteroidia bacterium]|nr:FprA family A-type flavoprotein [Bacteroidia bacterium]
MKDDKILDVSNDVKWIGILDKDLVTFDVVMETKFGTTYNSYFINADKKVIVETAKEKYFDTYLEKLKKVVAPESIDYIVMNHTEPDHSGCLRHLLQIAPQATVVGSGNAIRYLQDIIGVPFKSLQVKDGDTLSLGNKTLRFMSTPNLHWPDTMFTYLEEDKLLFTCDSFGAHFCDQQMFDDLVPNYDEAFEYYFDVIIKPYSRFMLKAIDKIKPLDIKTICTGHGPILRSHWKKYVDYAAELSSKYLDSIKGDEKNVLIAFVSAYGYTREMAEAFAEGIRKTNCTITVDLADVESMSLGEIDAKLTKCNGLIVGSPTLNQNIMLPVYKVFSMINPIRERGKPAMSFGSYGWSGEAVKIIDASLKSLKLNVIRDGIAIKFFPFGETRNILVEEGRKFAKAVITQPEQVNCD